MSEVVDLATRLLVVSGNLLLQIDSWAGDFWARTFISPLYVVLLLWGPYLVADSLVQSWSDSYYAAVEAGGNEPPIFATALLYLILPKRERQTLPGDLLEEYETTIVPKFGATYARLWYWIQVLRSVKPMLGLRIVKLISLGWLVDLVRRRLS